MTIATIDKFITLLTMLQTFELDVSDLLVEPPKLLTVVEIVCSVGKDLEIFELADNMVDTFETKIKGFKVVEVIDVNVLEVSLDLFV